MVNVVHNIKQFIPIKTILEIGCNSAPMLIRLAEKMPDLNLAGVDNYEGSIVFGKEQLTTEHKDLDITLHHGAAPEDLSYMFESDCFDLVFASGTLRMFPSKQNKIQTIKEMYRMARIGILIYEKLKVVDANTYFHTLQNELNIKQRCVFTDEETYIWAWVKNVVW
jgi:ubiquinone/menaquinone biosynthesis C-methylase UbiE